MTCVADIVLLVILLVVIGIGCFRGIIKFLKPFSTLAAFTVAWNFKGKLSLILMGNSVFDNWRESLYNNFYNAWSTEIEALMENGSVSEEELSGVFGVLTKLFQNMIDSCLESAEQGALSLTESAARFASEHIVEFVVGLISFAVIFLVVLIVLLIAFSLLKNLCSIKLINVTDKLLGALVGVLIGIIAVWTLAQVLVRFFPSAVVDSDGFTMWLYSEFVLSKMFGISA